MPGQPKTRARRDAGASTIPVTGPLDWAQRARPGVLEVNGNGHAAPRQRTMIDDLEDRRRRALEHQEIDDELEDADDQASLRARRRRLDKLKLDVEEQRLLGIMEKSLGGGDSQIAEVIREMNTTNAMQFDRMLELLRGDSRQQSSAELAELRGDLRNMQSQIQQALTQPQQDPDGTQGVMKALDLVTTIENKIRERQPEASGPAVEPGMTRDQVLRQIAIEEEADLRRAELKDKREDREFAREMAREGARTRRARLASAAGMVDQYAGPVLAAILGSRAQKLLGGGSEEGGEGLRTELGTKKAYQCPDCGAVNWEEPTVEITACPACGVSVRPFPQLHPTLAHDGPLDAPHHHHDDDGA